MSSQNDSFTASGSSPTQIIDSAPACDLIFENHFSLFLIRPASDLGKIWLDENLSADAQRLGDAVACESRFVEAIFRGATADGLVCR